MFLLDDINGHLYYIIYYFLAYFSAVLNCPFFMLFKFAPLLICSLHSVSEIKYKIYHWIRSKNSVKSIFMFIERKLIII